MSRARFPDALESNCRYLTPWLKREVSGSNQRVQEQVASTPTRRHVGAALEAKGLADSSHCSQHAANSFFTTLDIIVISRQLQLRTIHREHTLNCAHHSTMARRLRCPSANSPSHIVIKYGQHLSTSSQSKKCFSSGQSQPTP